MDLRLLTRVSSWELRLTGGRVGLEVMREATEPHKPHISLDMRLRLP